MTVKEVPIEYKGYAIKERPSTSYRFIVLVNGVYRYFRVIQ